MNIGCKQEISFYRIASEFDCIIESDLSVALYLPEQFLSFSINSKAAIIHIQPQFLLVGSKLLVRNSRCGDTENKGRGSLENGNCYFDGFLRA